MMTKKAKAKKLNPRRKLKRNPRPKLKLNPKPNMEAVRAANKNSDPFEKFLLTINSRAVWFLNLSDLPREAIAFEMMQSALSALESGREHAELSRAYPVKAWRENTVEVPRAWLRVLVDGWAKYKASPTGSTLGEAMGLEGGGQGNRPVRAQLEAFKRELHLSNAAAVEYLALHADAADAEAKGVSLDEDKRPTWEKAFAVVAEEKGVSPDTVKRAYREHGPQTLERMRDLGLLKD